MPQRSPRRVLVLAVLAMLLWIGIALDSSARFYEDGSGVIRVGRVVVIIPAFDDEADRIWWHTD